MVKKRSVTVTTLSCWLLLSCNPTIIKYSPTYFSNSEHTPETCTIVLPEYIRVNYQGDVENEFGKGDQNKLIRQFLRSQLKKEIQTSAVFKDVTTGTTYDNIPRQSVTLTTRKGEKTFSLPKDGQKLYCSSGTPDIVIILNEINLSSLFEMHISAGYSGEYMDPSPNFSSSKDLVMESKFMIWDNRSAQLVSYGFFQVVEKNRFAVTIDDWLRLIELVTDTILEKTPFKKRLL